MNNSCALTKTILDFFFKCSYGNINPMHHHQQDKCYPQMCLLAHFEATLDLAVANLLAHNNITLSYYRQVNSLRIKSSVASKWAIKHLCGYHLFCWFWHNGICE